MMTLRQISELQRTTTDVALKARIDALMETYRRIKKRRKEREKVDLFPLIGQMQQTLSGMTDCNVISYGGNTDQPTELSVGLVRDRKLVEIKRYVFKTPKTGTVPTIFGQDIILATHGERRKARQEINALLATLPSVSYSQPNASRQFGAALDRSHDMAVAFASVHSETGGFVFKSLKRLMIENRVDVKAMRNSANMVKFMANVLVSM